ncbi:hypothetical protein WJX81_002956 [Elliptochloris bilobata]|uniref:Uncharacterized protein n=1 Tax=Elliptochloris bilobata TaxID=381761 RepID=A0AAW1QHQ1_9CHLO
MSEEAVRRRARLLAAAVNTAAGPTAARAVASQGAAPAQAAAAPAAPVTADSQSTLEAEAAAFVNASEVFLAGVYKSVPWSIQSAAGRRTGRFSLADYVSPRFADANGNWMGHPQAVMHAAVKGVRAPPRTWVLELSRPRFNASADTLAFTVQVLGAGAGPKYPGGAAAYALANADGSLAAQPMVGTVLFDVVIFIDDAAGGAGEGREQPPVGAGDADAVNPGGTKLTSVPLTTAYQPGDFSSLGGQLGGPLTQATPVTTSASTLNSGQSLLPPLSNPGSGGLIQGGSAMVNSASVFGRTSYCPNLGWIYAADPYRCTPVIG